MGEGGERAGQELGEGGKSVVAGGRREAGRGAARCGVMWRRRWRWRWWRVVWCGVVCEGGVRECVGGWRAVGGGVMGRWKFVGEQS